MMTAPRVPDLHTQLNIVIAQLEQELADLEKTREALSQEIATVLYRHSRSGNRRIGRERRSGRDRREAEGRRNTPGRRANRERRLPQMQRLVALDAQITATLETMDILKNRREHLVLKLAGSATDGE